MSLDKENIRVSEVLFCLMHSDDSLKHCWGQFGATCS